MLAPEIVSNRFRKAFASGADSCRMTLRAGNAIDSYDIPPPYDETADRISDDYLERFHWGLAHLDAQSWRFYLPFFVDYAIRHITDAGSPVVDALLSSLRPPDREPPRLLSLSKEQEDAITEFLDLLSFHERSGFQDYAMTVLEEFWVEDPLYRDSRKKDTAG